MIEKHTIYGAYVKDLAVSKMLSANEAYEAFEEMAKLEREFVLAILTAYPESLNTVKAVAKKETSEDTESFKILQKLRAPFSKKGLHAVVSAMRENSLVRDVLVRTYIESDTPNATVLDTVHRLQTARNAFATANLRLVVSMVRPYTSMMDIQDLIQEGNFGLMKAIEKFDHKRGIKFSTYAGWWIRQSMHRSISEKGRMVRLPVHISEAIGKVRQEERVYFAKTGKNLNVDEIRARLGLSRVKVEAILMASAAPMSLDVPIGEDGDQTWLDLVRSNDDENGLSKIGHEELARDLSTLMLVLTPMENKIIKWRFAIGHDETLTLKEIADKYGLSRERIRQIESRALKKMKTNLFRMRIKNPSSMRDHIME